jgi:mannose/fructose/N-acetylgalactosamine-specific phosphotransferase system component IID
MKKWRIGLAVLAGYCIPFVYLALLEDFKTGTLLGYLLLLVGFTVLAFTGQRWGHLLFVVAGNIVSYFISIYFAGQMDTFDWDGYFKPLTAEQLILLVSLLMLIPQWIAIVVAMSLEAKKRVKEQMTE